MTRVLLFHYYLTRTFDDRLGSNFYRLLIYAYFEIHQLLRQVFDNYQECPVSLNSTERVQGDMVHLIADSVNEYRKQDKYRSASVDLRHVVALNIKIKQILTLQMEGLKSERAKSTFISSYQRKCINSKTISEFTYRLIWVPNQSSKWVKIYIFTRGSRLCYLLNASKSLCWLNN